MLYDSQGWSVFILGSRRTANARLRTFDLNTFEKRLRVASRRIQVRDAREGYGVHLISHLPGRPTART